MRFPPALAGYLALRPTMGTKTMGVVGGPPAVGAIGGLSWERITCYLLPSNLHLFTSLDFATNCRIQCTKPLATACFQEIPSIPLPQG